MSSKSKQKVHVEKSATKKPPPSTSKLRKGWYAVTAVIFFILVIVALISSSYTLILLSQTQACNGNLKVTKQTKNAAVVTIVFSTICLISVIGFVALQVRNQRRTKFQEKVEAQYEKAGDDDDDDDDEEEEYDEAEMQRTDDPAKLQKMIHDLPLPVPVPTNP